MAYGLIYKIRVGSLKYGNDIVIEILKDGYTGASAQKSLGAGGINLTKDDAGVIAGTSLTFSIQADANDEYLEFFELPTRTFQVILKKNNVSIWTGYLVTDEYIEEFIDPPYDVRVHATDGLGLLKNVIYVIEPLAATRITRVGALRKILDTIGLGLEVVIGYDVKVTSSSENIFLGATFADDYYDGWNCYEVLEKLIPPDATITQDRNQWLIRRNCRDAEKIHKLLVPSGGGYLESTQSGETALALAPMGSGDMYPTGSPAEKQVEKASTLLKLKSEHGKRESVLRNWNFSKGLDYWTETGGTPGTTFTFLKDGVYYILMQKYSNSINVSNGEVSQSAPFTATAFNLSYRCALYGYDRKEGEKYIAGASYARVRITITDGVTTYFYSLFEGWSTSSASIIKQLTSSPISLEWNNFSFDITAPPISGTLTVTLLRPPDDARDNKSDEIAVCFTDVKVQVQSDQNAGIIYELPIRDNGSEIKDVTLIPTDAPETVNFDIIYSNVHQVSGSAITSLTDGIFVNTWTNIIINNLRFIYGVSRQILTGRWRGTNLRLNNIISCPATGGRKYFIKSGTWNLYDDSIEAELLEIPGTETGSTWTVANTDWSSYGDQTSSQTTGSGTGGGSSSTISIPGAGGTSWLEAYFERVNPDTADEFIRCTTTLASEGDMVAYSADDTPSSLWDDLPIASTIVLGGVKVDGTTITADSNGVITAIGGGGGGVTDHGDLTGLADDDHTQYYNQTRGDARYSQVGHNHTGVYQPIDADLTSIANLTGTGFLKRTGVNTYSLDASSYEPAFTKNTAFNKNFGTAADTVCQGNDSRLSDSRTPLSHAHGNITNDGKIGSTSGLPIITTTAGALTAGSFGTTAGTFAQGNDSRFHTHSNLSNLDSIDQDLATDDNVEFNSLDVAILEVNTIIDGPLQTGYGINLLKHSYLFEEADWVPYNCTPDDLNAANPFGGDTIKSCLLTRNNTSATLIQSLSNTTTGNFTFSIWIKATVAHTASLNLYSNVQAGSTQSISVTTSWQRFNVTFNFTDAHTIKYVKISLGTQSLYIWGAQLEAGTAPTRYISTLTESTSENGIHMYADLRIDGNILAGGDVTAYSDRRLKTNIRDTREALDKVNRIKVVDYEMIADSSNKQRTGVIAQDILSLFPQFVSGSEQDYMSVNYAQMVSVAIKAIQELTMKVIDLENRLDSYEATGK